MDFRAPIIKIKEINISDCTSEKYFFITPNTTLNMKGTTSLACLNNSKSFIN